LKKALLESMLPIGDASTSSYYNVIDRHIKELCLNILRDLSIGSYLFPRIMIYSLSRRRRRCNHKMEQSKIVDYQYLIFLEVG
jgi:hypothetical protein